MEQVRENTGSITANAGVLQLNVQGLSALVIDLTGTFTATVIFEYTINGKDWYTLTTTIIGSTTTATGATAAGKWLASVAGFSAVRVRCTAFTSGTILGALRAVLSNTANNSGDLGTSADASQTDATQTATLIAVAKGLLAIATKKLASISNEITRPADTTAYTALDVVSDSTSAPTVITFTGAARISGGSGYITKAQLATDQKTNVARFRLHLFNASPTAINDNAPFLTLYANKGSYVGSIDFPASATEDTSNSTQAIAQLSPGSGNLPLAFVCNADANLYGILEALDGFTPASGQKVNVKLIIDQD